MEFFDKHKNDILLILAALVLAGGCWLFTRLTRQTGAVAVVTVDGVERGRYSLDTDAEFSIDAVGGVNLLHIENGCASVVSADCPDKVCVRRGEIRYDGETIVCLPHRLVVELLGGEGSGVDAVAE